MFVNVIQTHTCTLCDYSTHFSSSSSLLAIGSRSHSTRVHRKQPTSPPPSLPLPSVPGSRGGMEGDILCQWRLRRRLEQARNHTAGLTARLDDCSLPMFKSQSLRTEYGGHHPPVSKEVGRDGHRVQPHQLPLAAESYLPAPHTTTGNVNGAINHWCLKCFPLQIMLPTLASNVARQEVALLLRLTLCTPLVHHHYLSHMSHILSASLVKVTGVCLLTDMLCVT